MKYSILIITFHKRFEEWLKPLVIEIKRQRADVEIIICVNGELNYFNEDYRAKILTFIVDFKNVFPVVFPRFRSFARMVNLGVMSATEDIALVLSDDITLEDGFLHTYEHILGSYQTFGVNTCFNVFSITKRDLIDVGWFDERLLGMGWEDGDFFRRYEKCKGGKFPNTIIESCKNHADKKFYKVYNEKLEKLLKEEVRLEGQKLDDKFGRYSKFNHDIYESNLLMTPVNQYPLEQFYLDNRHLL